MILNSKAEYESKVTKEKKENERRKNILVLTYRHLINLGYCESALKLNEESNLSLDKYDTADNIDLNMIFLEFETFFEQKFGKKPKFIIGLSGDKINKTVSLPQVSKKKNNNVNSNNINGNNSTNKNLPIQKQKSDEANLNNLQLEIVPFHIQGNNGKDVFKEDTFKERKESLLLKPLPDIFFNDELKELALAVKREIIIENPNINFNDIIGVDKAKDIIKEALFVPMKYPDLFTGILEPWKGILLFGPPGTGKTMLAKAVSSQMPSTFFNISASTIVSKWRGDSEKIIRVLFDLARYYQPSTIFLDEIDSIMSQRSGKDEHDASRRMKTELLIQLDGWIIKKRKRKGIFIGSK